MSDDVEALRQSLTAAQAELASMREAHEAAMTRLQAENDQVLIASALRAEAMRLGAHNPDDVVRLMDRGDVVRGRMGR